MLNDEIIMALIVWSGLLGLLILIDLSVGRLKNRRERAVKSYIERFSQIFLVERDINATLKKVCFSLPKASKLHRILAKGLGLKTSEKAMEFIESRLNAWPIEVLHSFASANEVKTKEDIYLNEKLLKNFYDIRRLWILERQTTKKQIRNQKLGLWAFKELVFILNAALYYLTRDTYSMYLMLGINTLGIGIFIVVDLYLELREDNFIKQEDMAIISLLFDLIEEGKEKEIVRSFESVYPKAPVDIKDKLKKLQQQIRVSGNNILSFWGTERSMIDEKLYRLFATIYENPNKKGQDAIDIMSSALVDYIEACHEKAIEKISLSSKKALLTLKNFYRLAANASVMANIAILLLMHIRLNYGIFI